MNDWPEFDPDGEYTPTLEKDGYWVDEEGNARTVPVADAARWDSRYNGQNGQPLCILSDQDPPQRHPYLFLEKRRPKLTPLQIVCRAIGWTLFALICFVSVCICLGYGRGKP